MNNSLNNLIGEQASTEIFKLTNIYQQLINGDLLSDSMGGAVSYKHTAIDLYGNEVEVLSYIDTSTTVPVIARLDVLRKLTQLTCSPKEEWRRELISSRLTSDSSIPGEAALLHACVTSGSVVLVTCEPLMTLGCVKTWRDAISKNLGPDVIPIDYSEYGPAFYREVLRQTQHQPLQAVYLRYRGLLILSEDLEQGAEEAFKLAKKASDAIVTVPLLPVSATEKPDTLRIKIAQYRNELSGISGRRLLIRHLDNLSPNAWIEKEACTENHLKVLTKEMRELPQPDATLGAIVYAGNATELEYKVKITQSAVKIKQYASVLGEAEFLPVSYASFENAESTGIFAGEVALVTGAATGIGKACVASLLARGAAVVALDIKREIVNLFSTPAYLGIQCDLTDAIATIQCIETGVRAFGGMDMLVLNAGIFPSSCSIDSMSMEYWRKVMDINLDVNITLLREGYALLKYAPRYGRVVINASRNVPAPGPGAAAYSASKSALTQLGRVAALEWGPSHIRVNMLHPHAVFDTGIWTDDVIKSRASKYGLTVEQYKTNNILGVELYSHDIGELIAEMLGPVFSKTTGAQVPVDGGCDRVI
jgi:NAD(P)-dependent dehydrogenase (short-subunit alcohol dehydrogenase family)